MLNFTIVNCLSEEFDIFFNKYKSEESDKIKKIRVNFLEISEKLQHNDIEKKVPQHYIVKFNIIKKINKILSSNGENVHIVYFLNILDFEIITSIKKLVGNNNVCWRLFTKNKNLPKNISNSFDCIEYLRKNI